MTRLPTFGHAAGCVVRPGLPPRAADVERVGRGMATSGWSKDWSGRRPFRSPYLVPHTCTTLNGWASPVCLPIAVRPLKSVTRSVRVREQSGTAPPRTCQKVEVRLPCAFQDAQTSSFGPVAAK